MAAQSRLPDDALLPQPRLLKPPQSLWDTELPELRRATDTAFERSLSCYQGTFR